MFVIYFIITFLLIIFQSIASGIAIYSDMTTYSNPSKPGFLAEFVFGVLQLLRVISLESYKITCFRSNDALLATP